ncbi:MAG: hypothetical protein ACJ8F7_07000 [Gemmataceae bacterium]
MSRLLACLFALLSAALTFAQSGPQISFGPGAPAELKLAGPVLPLEPKRAPTLENHVRFDPLSVELRHESNRWQLWAGHDLLKDFGTNREHANDARRLIADLQLTEHTTIGTPEPAMEYWLTNGKAPAPPTTPRQILSIDPSTLKVDRQEGNYCVRDARQVLFQFGTADEARVALAAFQQYGFNEIGLIGSPVPSMVYLVNNPNPRTARSRPEEVFKPRVLPTQAGRHPLTLPKLGTVGERMPIDPMRADLYHAADGWHLMAGPHDLGNVGSSDYLARVSLRTLQQYPLTEYDRVGGIGFYLSRGQAPLGVPLGVRSAHFDPKSLAVKPQGDQLALTDGRQTVATFPQTQAADAKQALQVLQHFGFDTQCEIGGLRYLARER